MGEGGEGELQQQLQMEEMVAEEGSILAPEGSSVEDGSIIAAGGIVLAPPGTVMMGEDGKLMMAENSALLAQEGDFVSGECGNGERG